MTDKQLTNKAIDIKGKKYVLVSDRVIYFNEQYPNGSIATERTSQDGMEVVKATVTPDCDKPQRFFTGYSQAKWGDGFINKTSALENAETSAVGRALAMMGIGVIDSIASMDEINKAENTAKANKPSYKDDKGNPNGWFQKAISNTKFMQECMSEEDFIAKIKNKYEVDEIVESQLRDAYKNANSIDSDTVELPFS